MKTKNRPNASFTADNFEQAPDNRPSNSSKGKLHSAINVRSSLIETPEKIVSNFKKREQNRDLFNIPRADPEKIVIQQTSDQQDSYKVAGVQIETSILPSRSVLESPTLKKIEQQMRDLEKNKWYEY